MRGKISRRWKILVPAICLAIFLAAEKSSLIRTDSISAVACTKELFLTKPEPSAIISQYKEAISAESRRRDLPPELLATIIYAHQRGLTSFRRFTDCSGSAIGRDLSLGLGQIRISTAVSNDGLEYGTLSPGNFRKYRSVLLDPLRNIRYLAKEVRLLLDRHNRFPGISSEELIHNPFAMALVMSEYRMGRQAAGSSAARLIVNAFGDLEHLQKNAVYIFGRDAADVIQIQESVRKYLDYVYCEKGIFNSAACEARLD